MCTILYNMCILLIYIYIHDYICIHLQYIPRNTLQVPQGIQKTLDGWSYSNRPRYQWSPRPAQKKTRIPNSPLGESSHLVIGLKNPCDNESSISWLWLIYDIYTKTGLKMVKASFWLSWRWPMVSWPFSDQQCSHQFGSAMISSCYPTNGFWESVTCGPRGPWSSGFPCELWRCTKQMKLLDYPSPEAFPRFFTVHSPWFVGFNGEMVKPPDV